MFVESLLLNILIWIFVTTVGGTISIVLGNHLYTKLSEVNLDSRKTFLALFPPALIAIFAGLYYFLGETGLNIIAGITLLTILFGYYLILRDL